MFIPRSLDSSSSAPLCAAIEVAQAARPPSTEEFRAWNLAMFVIFMVLFYAILAPALFYYRNHPRFSKIRPYWMSLLLFTGGTAMCLASFLRMAIPATFPCILVVFGFIYTMHALGAVFNSRALVFIVESELQTRMLKRQEQPGGESNIRDSESLATDTESRLEFYRPPTLSALKAIVLIGLGLREMETVPLSSLAQVRRPLFSVYFVGMFLFFAFLAMVILFAVYPELFLCVGCDPYDEIVITAIVFSVPDILFLARMCYVGYKKHHQRDVHGVIQEFVLVSFTAMPTVILGMLFEILDPGQVDWNNIFAWEWLIMISGTLLLLICGFLQLGIAFMQHRDDRKMDVIRLEHRASLAAMSGAQLMEIISGSSATKELAREFEQFSAGYYVLELVHFLKDVSAFRRYFAEKNDKWRLQKARLLTNIYIRVGAEEEVNISERLRKHICALVDSISPGTDASKLKTVFDEAFKEVIKMVQHGVWRRFIEHSSVAAAYLHVQNSPEV